MRKSLCVKTSECLTLVQTLERILSKGKVASDNYELGFSKTEWQSNNQPQSKGNQKIEFARA